MNRSSLALSLALFACGYRLAAEEPRMVTITARRFEFSPREIHLKKGEPVVLVLGSQDVTHGLFCRKLGIDTDITPGQETRLNVTPASEGRFTAICNHFCGGGHGNMKLTFIVE